MKRIISAAVIFTALCSYATVTADSPDDKATQALDKVNAIDQKVQTMQTDLTQHKEKVSNLEKQLGTTDGKYQQIFQGATAISKEAKEAATEAKQTADAAKQNADAAKQSAEASAQTAETAKQSAETSARKVSELENKLGGTDEKYRNLFQGTTTISKEAKEAATEAKQTATEAKQNADAAKQSADAAKQSAETSARTAETAKQSAEASARTAETARQSAEDAARTATTAQQTAQAIRQTAETANRTAQATQADTREIRQLHVQNLRTVTDLQTDLQTLRHHTRQGLAKVTAVSGLRPLSFDKNAKWSLSVATGSYKNEHAVAMGAFYQPNRDMLFSFGSSLAAADNAYTFGASVRLGKGREHATAQPSDRIEELYAALAKLQAESARHKQLLLQLQAVR
ncbi:YadA-like family protein [uncultured Megasphaera sp.]|uniref:YadA C-terminal domain-containing protein n=1 Tax=uncultured Megasphaera sp. TaxID=165188 RepID=UPI00259748C6|nr:YadA-like family protein [uncultured Megasphaera sp.]